MDGDTNCKFEVHISMIAYKYCNFLVTLRYPAFLFKMAVRVANYKGKFHTCCGTDVQLSPDRESADIIRRDLLGLFLRSYVFKYPID